MQNLVSCVFSSAFVVANEYPIDELPKEIFQNAVIYDTKVEDTDMINRDVFIQFVDFMHFLKDKDISIQSKKFIYKYLNYYNECLVFMEQNHNKFDALHCDFYLYTKELRRKYFFIMDTDFSINTDAKECSKIKVSKLKLDDSDRIVTKIFFGKILYQDVVSMITICKSYFSSPKEITVNFLLNMLNIISKYVKCLKLIYKSTEDDQIKEELIKDINLLNNYFMRYGSIKAELDTHLNSKHVYEQSLSVLDCSQPRVMIDGFPTDGKGYMYAVMAVNKSGEMTYTDVIGYSQSPIEAENDCFLSIYNKWLNNKPIKAYGT